MHLGKESGEDCPDDEGEEHPNIRNEEEPSSTHSLDKDGGAECHDEIENL
jgi:hypothetical protein